jgi:two-component system, sporulation sensor kinase B
LFQDLLINFLFMLIPIFFYQIYLLNSPQEGFNNRSQWIMGLLSGIASALCMAYPINVGTDFLWDLRWVPFLTAVLYGGWRGGAAAFVCLVGYRFYLGGGAAFIAALLDTLIPLPLLLRFRPVFFQLRYKKKMLVSLLIAAIFYLFMLLSIYLFLLYRNNVGYMFDKGVWFYLAYGALYLAAMASSIHIVELLYDHVKMREEMQRSEKLSLISELAASIAHEVRNPLTVVRGFIQLAQQSMDEQNRRYMSTAIVELDRAEFIISDYLNFAKPEVDAPEVIDVGEKVSNVASIMSSFATMQDVQLHHHSESGLFINANRTKLKQVIMNLIKNSIEATPNGGQVIVRSFLDNKHVLIQVLDTGAGMTSDQLKRLGTPFYSTKEKGTGLGLMVTFRMVEAMGGQLKFRSEKGKGTVATISIPAIAQ